MENKKKSKKKKLTVKDLKNKEIGIETKNYMKITNLIEDTSIEQYNINYDFYIKICNEIIDVISPKVKQLSLF